MGAVVSQTGSYVPNALLSRLIDFRLYSVQFVMDYVQLRFDGPTEEMPVLNCDVLPAAELAGRTVKFGDIGYADALRAFIPKVVEATVEQTGIGLRLEFDGGGAIALHPRVDELVGPEIALLGGFADKHWMCWRPGEKSFEDVS